jgi:hypothetical protein
MKEKGLFHFVTFLKIETWNLRCSILGGLLNYIEMKFKKIGRMLEDCGTSFYVACTVATLLWESVRMKLTLPKSGLGSPLGLPKLQKAIARVKTPCLEEFFISLKSYWNVDVQNGIALPIWTFATQVMAKRKVGNQIGSLTPDHGKSGIDLIYLRAGSVQHVIGKLSMKDTTLCQIIAIGGLHKKLWSHKVAGVPTVAIGSPRTNTFKMQLYHTQWK